MKVVFLHGKGSTDPRGRKITILANTAEAQRFRTEGDLQFDSETVFTKAQAALILAIDERTVDRYVADLADELQASGSRVLKGKSLKNINLAYVDDTGVVDIIDSKTCSGRVLS